MEMVILSGGMRQGNLDTGTTADFGFHGQRCSQQLRPLAHVLLSVMGPVVCNGNGGSNP